MFTSNKRQRTIGPTSFDFVEPMSAFPPCIESLIRSYTGISVEVVKERHEAVMREISFFVSLTRKLFDSENIIDLIRLLEESNFVYGDCHN